MTLHMRLISREDVPHRHLIGSRAKDWQLNSELFKDCGYRYQMRVYGYSKSLMAENINGRTCIGE